MRTKIGLWLASLALVMTARSSSAQNNDRVGAVVAALEVLRADKAAGKTTLVPSADTITDLGVSQRLGYSIGDRDPEAVVSFKITGAVVGTSTATINVESSIRDPKNSKSHLEGSTVVLARDGLKWKVTKVTLDEIS